MFGLGILLGSFWAVPEFYKQNRPAAPAIEDWDSYWKDSLKMDNKQLSRNLRNGKYSKK